MITALIMQSRRKCAGKKENVGSFLHMMKSAGNMHMLPTKYIMCRKISYKFLIIMGENVGSMLPTCVGIMLPTHLMCRGDFCKSCLTFSVFDKSFFKIFLISFGTCLQ